MSLINRPSLLTSVLVNVYDLHPNNTMTMMIGLGGMFHTGVEIGFTEYSYGGTEESVGPGPRVSTSSTVVSTSSGGGSMNGEDTGVFECEPRMAHGCKYRETIEMGMVDASSSDFKRVMEKLRREFKTADYHILDRNCNTFCNELLIRLTGHGLPGYITRLASIGKCCTCCLPPSFLSQQKNEKDSFALLERNEKNAKSQFKPFKGPGYSLASQAVVDASSLPSEVRDARREKFARKS